jgi:hypothetical protein
VLPILGIEDQATETTKGSNERQVTKGREFEGSKEEKPKTNDRTVETRRGTSRLRGLG